MTMRAFGNLVAFILALAVATALVAWWVVPVVAFVWTIAAPRRGGVLYAAAAGGISWVAILLVVSRSGSVGAVDRLFASLMGMPSHTILALTVVYGALLSASAALLAQAIRPPAPTGATPSRSG